MMNPNKKYLRNILEVLVIYTFEQKKWYFFKRYTMMDSGNTYYQGTIKSSW